MIGDNLKRLRLKKDLTQEELAKQLNINQSMIARIETGTKEPSIQLCRGIAKVLNCKLEDLVN